ncbi:MAG: dCMP deaminase family protein [Nannocystaceae bacterium]
MSLKWDRRFLELAHHISLWSKDPSTKVGCVVVGPDREIRSTGFNGFPRGIQDTAARLEDRSLKYPLICHAEENAIMHAARIGIALKDCIAYVTWPPCTRCARSLVQAGVREVAYPDALEIPERWRDDFSMSMGMLKETGVRVHAVVRARQEVPTGRPRQQAEQGASRRWEHARTD